VMARRRTERFRASAGCSAGIDIRLRHSRCSYDQRRSALNQRRTGRDKGATPDEREGTVTVRSVTTTMRGLVLSQFCRMLETTQDHQQ